MEKNMKIIIAVVVVILLALVAAFAMFSNSDQYLLGTGADLTVPSTFELDQDKLTASNDDVILIFNGILGNTNEVSDFYKAISENGKSAGYQNISEDTINGFKVYEYEADPHNLTTLKYGSSTKWIEYEPTNLTDGTGSKIDTTHFRKVYYISPNNSVANELTIIAKNPGADLHSKEIEDIIHSIKVSETN